MTKEKLQISFFIGLLTMTAILSFLIFLPYLNILILALVLAIVFNPLYDKILSVVIKKEWLAAILTILVVIFIVLIPLVIISFLMWKEAAQFYTDLTDGTREANIINTVSAAIGAKFKVISPGVSLNIEQAIKQTVGWIFGQIGAIFSSVAQFIFGFLLTIMTLFYFLKDGRKIIRAAIRLSPLKDEYDTILIEKFRKSVHTVVAGTLTVAIIQGLLVSIGFYLFGIPNGMLWGSAAAIASLIPFVGTTIVLIPAIAYLFLIGNTISALGLFIWGSVAVGLIDNFLSPKLIGRNIGIHPLLILFSILGGLVFFGPIGLLIGPLVLSLLFALLEIYQSQLAPR